MRTALIGAGLLGVGALALATGVLPVDEAVALWDRVWPVLLFVLAMTVVTELAAEAGLFDWLAQHASTWAHGRSWLLWLIVVALATVCTIFLSLDTTAVLLTPVVIVMARHAGISPVPFVLTTVWLANTASMLLPVSNLTNLLAVSKLEQIVGHPVSPIEFASLTWAPALVAIVVPVAVIGLLHRRSLFTRYVIERPERITDPTLLIASAVAVVILIPGLLSGLPVWIPACVAAVTLVIAFAVSRPIVLRASLVPWPLLLLVTGLFLVLETAHALGLGDALATVSGTGDDPLSLLQLAGIGAGGANIANNLPAYLALEPSVDSPARMIALLIGVNVGPLITPWASLATLLWHDRLTSMGVEFRWSRYVLLGVVLAPLAVLASTAALALR
ncbi:MULTISPECIES: SLC13 family permease [unclassified Leifsonia]|uniref:SLC13 family permease n=1 Tax=unclassified Leifsonia TaxID=2663824 RepID=UPI0006F78B6B|nr:MULTISPECIES: SLC13 family permease [unclassified Leifsonia]KQX07298.1 arsenic transporter [Leifsonia sp. Root1293]KRA11581.1 arsenic transporter [Leifsonia sp. Root60]